MQLFKLLDRFQFLRIALNDISTDAEDIGMEQYHFNSLLTLDKHFL